MTYVRDQTSEELATHMRSLQKMAGWHDPLADRLWEEVEKLKAENEALRKAAAKWKSDSLCGSEDVYRLSCDLAQRTGEVRELAGVVDDLCALAKQFVQRLRKAAPDSDLPEKAMDYLKRKGLQGSPLRAAMSKGEQP